MADARPTNAAGQARRRQIFDDAAEGEDFFTGIRNAYLKLCLVRTDVFEKGRGFVRRSGWSLQAVRGYGSSDFGRRSRENKAYFA